MYSFVRRPAWAILHVVVLAITVAFVLLGLWQLRRLDDRRAENATIAQRLSADPVEWTGADGGVPPEYTRLVLVGVFETDHEVLLRSQVHLGQPGFDVLTPLVVDQKSTVIVNRGWVPLEFDSPPIEVAFPAEGLVTVGGFVRYPLANAGVAAPDGTEGPVAIVPRVDLARLDRQIESDLASFYLVLVDVDPPAAALPVASPLPELTEGPHFSYALQWFGFALVSTVGYGALIRSTARRRAGLSRREAFPRLPPS